MAGILTFVPVILTAYSIDWTVICSHGFGGIFAVAANGACVFHRESDSTPICNATACGSSSRPPRLRLPPGDSCWVSRMREICQSGLTRGEAAYAPPLLYWFKIFAFFDKDVIHESNGAFHGLA